MKLSVVINTFNDEETLEAALKSVKFADEIVIVDVKSTDDTVKIAKKYTDLIYANEFVEYVEPVRNFAISKATGDWIFILDADEEVPQELEKLIKGILKSSEAGEKTADCYYIPRRNIIFGKWIENPGWWPDHVLRLFKKGYVEWSDKIHSIPTTTGEVHELPVAQDIAIIHHNYQRVDQYIDRMNKYSSIQAAEVLNSEDRVHHKGIHKINSEGREGVLGHEDKEITPRLIFKKFSSEFLSRLFDRRGVSEGNHGLSLSLLQSISEAAIMMKVWETTGFPESAKSQEPELIKAISQFKRELSYWLADWQVEHSRGLKKVCWQVRRKLKL